MEEQLQLSRCPYRRNGGDTEPLLGGAEPRDSDEGETIFDRSLNVEDEGAAAQRRLTFEEAVEEAGFGLFHWLLLLACGWANASDAVEILCVSFLLPTARCDLQLSTADMGLLTASIFVGMMVGGYMWGCLADRRGRRRVLVLSLAVNGLFGGVASVAPSFWLFLLLRFISGVGVGGSIPVVFSYFSEFMPRLRRGAMVSALATFWMAGNILAAGLAWLVIPSGGVVFSARGVAFQSWRLFVALCSAPSLSSALLFWLLLPESPKFLMEAGREREALQVFRLIFRINARRSRKTFPDVSLFTNTKQREVDERKTSRRRGLTTILQEGSAPVLQMFTWPLRSRSTALLIIFYSISFGYYGLWMWFPQLLARIEDAGSPCANISHLLSPQHNHSCYPVKTAVYMEGFIIAASNLPGNIFSILMMDRSGGRLLLSGSLLASSLSVFFIYKVQTKGQSLLLSCIFSGVSVIAWNALDVLGTELYPTQLRSSALGFFTGAGRVAAITGNLVFGNLVESNCAVPVLLVSVLLLSGGLAALLLPQSRQTELT